MENSLENQKTLFVMGGYTHISRMAHKPKGTEGDGVSTFVFDPVQKKMQFLQSIKIQPNPAFIMKHPTLDILYMTTEVIDENGSEIITASIDRVTGKIQELDRKFTNGSSACHIQWDWEKKNLVVVQYWDSVLAVFPVGIDGRLGEMTQKYQEENAKYVQQNNPTREEHQKYRQKWPHYHQAVNDSFSVKNIFVPDLGQDRIQYFQFSDSKIQKLGHVQLPKTPGPRHIVLNTNQAVMYVNNELNNTVSTLKYNNNIQIDQTTNFVHESDQPNSLLFHLQTIPTVPTDFDQFTHGAEIRLHPNNKFLYIANRGHNSIAIFKVLQDGTLENIGFQDSFGVFPRHFNFDNTGRFMIVANHCSDNLVVFEVNQENGTLNKVDQVNEVPSKVWILNVNVN